MTDCRTTRDWILEVDPEELEKSHAPAGHGRTSEPAAHLAKCPECRALANEILEAEASLRDRLDSMEPVLDVAAALARAHETHLREEAHRSSNQRRRWQVAVPLAAAALGGLLLWGGPSPTPVPGIDPATVRAARALGLVGPRPVVRAGSDERVAVLPTENPNITVIWFME